MNNSQNHICNCVAVNKKIHSVYIYLKNVFVIRVFGVVHFCILRFILFTQMCAKGCNQSAFFQYHGSNGEVNMFGVLEVKTYN